MGRLRYGVARGRKCAACPTQTSGRGQRGDFEMPYPRLVFDFAPALVIWHGRCRAVVIEQKILPGGVIGNTRVFGTRIPGSSPGRVVVYDELTRSV